MWLVRALTEYFFTLQDMYTKQFRTTSLGEEVQGNEEEHTGEAEIHRAKRRRYPHRNSLVQQHYGIFSHYWNFAGRYKEVSSKTLLFNSLIYQWRVTILSIFQAKSLGAPERHLSGVGRAQTIEIGCVWRSDKEKGLDQKIVCFIPARHPKSETHRQLQHQNVSQE